MAREADRTGSDSDPYGDLSHYAPELVDGIQLGLIELGLTNESLEWAAVNWAAANAVISRWNQGRFQDADELRDMPPTLAAAWGVFDFVAAARYRPAAGFPLGRPVLGLRRASHNTLYQINFEEYMPLDGEYSQYQLYTALRTVSLPNGSRKTGCLQFMLGVHKNGAYHALSPSMLNGGKWVQTNIETMSAQGLLDVGFYN